MSEFNSTNRIIIMSSDIKKPNIKGETIIINHSKGAYYPPGEYKEHLEKFFNLFFEFIAYTGVLPEISVQEIPEEYRTQVNERELDD